MIRRISILLGIFPTVDMVVTAAIFIHHASLVQGWYSENLLPNISCILQLAKCLRYENLLEQVGVLLICLESVGNEIFVFPLFPGVHPPHAHFHMTRQQ